MTELWTIGHSNRSAEEFVDLLREFHIEVLVDVRRFPTSRWPHFKSENLREILRSIGIEYIHLEGLGGFRSGGYRRYMNTVEFQRALDELMSIARSRRTAIMCAEKLFFRCHRRYVADAIVARGDLVVHIIDSGQVKQHSIQRSISD